jgi:hypothetical protein
MTNKYLKIRPNFKAKNEKFFEESDSPINLKKERLKLSVLIKKAEVLREKYKDNYNMYVY